MDESCDDEFPCTKVSLIRSNMATLVLSFDGGGARVVLQYYILRRLIEQFPALLSQISVFAGTSAGSILAAAIASGRAHDLDMSKAFVDSIFHRSTCHTLISLGGLVKAKYANDVLRAQLTARLGGDTTLLVNVPRPLFITGFSMVGAQERRVGGTNHQHLLRRDEPVPAWLHTRCTRWHNVYFHNFEEDDQSSDTLVDVVMKSTAAPTYFPMVDHVVDGGIANNNPSLAVTTNLIALGVPLETIYVLSIGSGEKARQYDGPANASLGVVQWLPLMLNVLFDANAEAISQSCFHILSDRFHRVNPVLVDDITLDSTSDYDSLVRVANDVDLEETYAWIEKTTETKRAHPMDA